MSGPAVDAILKAYNKDCPTFLDNVEGSAYEIR